MKRLSFMILFSLFLIVGLSVGATTNNSVTDDRDQLNDAGLVPGDFFYFLDRFFEDVSLKFTINDEKKVAKYIKYAEERLAELNEINPEKNQQWIDKLYDEYGVSLNKANDILTTLILDDDFNVRNKEKLQIRIENITTKEELIKGKTKEKINEEVKEKVKELKVQTYLTAMCEELSEEDYNSLAEQNIRRQDMIRIKALSTLSGLSIREVSKLDIYLPNDPISKNDNKNIDFEKLKTELGLDKEELVSELKEYNKVLNENRRAEKERQIAERSNRKSQEEIERLKEEARKRKEEAEKKREEIEKKINEKINGNGNDGTDKRNGKNN